MFAHGISQSLLAGVQGGDMLQSFVSGALSSIVSSAWAGGDLAKGTEWKGVGGNFAGSDVGTLVFGTAAGAGGAALTKGNIWQGAAIGLVVSGLNHVAHSGDDNAKIEQTKSTGETTNPDEKPYILNQSKKTIHYKPESTSEALPLGPGEKTYDPVDGINVRGKVYKVPDGYTSVTVKANFKVYMRYDNLFYLGVGMYKGGLVTRSDFDKNDTAWDNLFKIKN